MLGDRVGDRGLLAVGQRVMAAHDSLQLGKLAHHRRQQIGLAQAHRARDIGLVDARHVRDHGGDHGLHAVDLVGQTADVGVEDDLPEARNPGAQRCGAILVPEELGIGQPRPQHPVVAGHDRPRRHRPPRC